MTAVALIFPHQLFDSHPALKKGRRVLLVEDSLFFGDPVWKASFHRLKLELHRTSMAAYQQRLRGRGYEVDLLSYTKGKALNDQVGPWLMNRGIDHLHVCDVVDDVLDRRLNRMARCLKAKIHTYPTPMFLTPSEVIQEFFDDRKRYFMADFYKAQRKRLKVLMEGEKPVGGRWSFDEENRKRWPKGASPPPVYRPASFPYPTTHEEAEASLRHFLQHRFRAFGDYEDAMVAKEPFLHHSVLTPALNVGLLTPGQVLDETLSYAKEHKIPINSVEGFVRQIAGWREFMRAVYVREGVAQRTANFWGHQREIPASFYQGTTGLVPFDAVVSRLNNHAYCHHIERLMVAGNLMMLCGIHPDAVYRWFMELFIDAYAWVMVPNVYGMSQFADGGLITTKPYLSGSNYLRKMSDFPAGPWCDTWDGLYWRFIDRHRDFFEAQPRLGMMVRMLDKMPAAKRRQHHRNADAFLDSLE